MQVSEVLTGTPQDMKTALENIAAVSQIQIIQKTKSAGSYIVVYDDSGSSGQFIDIVEGDPDMLSGDLSDIIGAGGVIDLVEKTFSAAVYLVVWV